MFKQLFFFVLFLILLITTNSVFAEDLNDTNFWFDLNSGNTNFNLDADFNTIYMNHALKVSSFSVPKKSLLNHDFVFQLSLKNDENIQRNAVIYCSLEQDSITVKTCNSKTLSFEPFEEKTTEFKFKLDNIQAVHSELILTVNYDLNKKIVLLNSTEIENPSAVESIKNFLQGLTKREIDFQGKELPFALIIIICVVLVLAFRS